MLTASASVSASGLSGVRYVTSEEVNAAQRKHPGTRQTVELQRQYERQRTARQRQAVVEEHRAAIKAAATRLRERVALLPKTVLEGFVLCRADQRFAERVMMACAVAGGFIAVSPYTRYRLETLVGHDRLLVLRPQGMWDKLGALQNAPCAVLRELIEASLQRAVERASDDELHTAFDLANYLTKATTGQM